MDQSFDVQEKGSSCDKPKSAIVRFPRLPRRFPRLPKSIRRFPRLPEPQSLVDGLNAEDLTEKSNLAEANMLLMEGRVGLADTSRGILVAGRAFNKLKRMFPKGTWLPRLKMEAEKSGHSVRSIQEYMKAAKEADAKNAKPRVFAKAIDPQAVVMTEAGERAAQKVADAITATELTGTTELKTKKPPRKSPPLLDGRFHLPLYLTGDEKKASKQMLASQNWPRVQKYLTAKWRRLLAQYGYLVLDT